MACLLEKALADHHSYWGFSTVAKQMQRKDAVMLVVGSRQMCGIVLRFGCSGKLTLVHPSHHSA